MTGLHEVREPFEVDTPIGRGLLFFVEYGTHDYKMTVAMHDGGALVSFPQSKIRVVRCYTQGRGITDEQMREIVRG